MKVVKVKLEIRSENNKTIECILTNKLESVQLTYVPAQGRFDFSKENELSKTICKLKFQFEKIMRSALNGKVTKGQEINCVFIEGFNFLNEGEFNQYIRVDRREGKLRIHVSSSGKTKISKIYADGCHLKDLNQSGYGGFIEHASGVQEVYHRSIPKGSSNLVELLAIIEGLQRLSLEDTIQVNTDSRFVIRGLVQWIHFWQHNNWQTAYGNQVKFVEYWKQINRLCEGKLIEFKWIKGHSGHEKQEFCHQLARKSAARKMSS